MNISMKPALHPGDTITTAKGETYVVKAFLGRGGQGEVHRVSGPSGDMALKWYHNESFLKKINAEAFYRNIKRNVEHGVPKLSAGDTATQFIWPLKLVPWQKGSFGYLMRLFPSGYENMTSVLLGRRKTADGKEIPLRWGSWFALVTAALNIVRAFEILHSKGLSYQDLNEGGLAVNMTTGDVMICDCDNVSPDSTNMGILGIMHYMAPEVVCGISLPDRQSDEYSLAVILFRLFYHDHPMLGIESVALRSNERLSQDETNLRIFGREPHYCLSQQNSVNRPHPRFHTDVIKLMGIFPEVLLDAFHTVFTQGVKDKGARLTSTQWRRVLLQVRDSLVLVNGKEQFFFTPQQRSLPKAARLLMCPGGQRVLVMPGKILYACHADGYSRDFATPIAKVIETNKPDIIGLYNGMNVALNVEYQGQVMECPPKGRMPLFEGMTIRIGSNEIQVK